MTGQQGAFLRHGLVLVRVPIEIDAGLDRFVGHVPSDGALDFPVAGNGHLASHDFGIGRSIGPERRRADQFNGVAGPSGGAELPRLERGRIGIFNRSYYEEVLVVRVHPEQLREEGLSKQLRDDKSKWEDRYRSIANFEEHLDRNSTRVVKMFLHISKDEQRRRFLARIDDPGKNWKLSLADIRERKFWNDYVRAYEECISATSTHRAPWYVVPADDKDDARLIVSQIVLDALRELKPSYPETTRKHRAELKAIRKVLAK